MSKEYDCSIGELPEMFNFGKNWLPEHYELLKARYNEGASFYELCKESGRSPSTVLAKLTELRLLVVDPRSHKHLVRKHPSRLASTGGSGIVIIRGKDVSEMSDLQIFSLIADLEAEHDKLLQIKQKPKKLAAAIQALTDDIDKLSAYVDAR